MATKNTQKLILDTAIDLFNQYGTARISANRIADICNLSRGNLYYHFKNKGEIIDAIYGLIAAEVRSNRVDGLKKPAVHHMLEMFDRYLSLVWRYRFFYREMTALLAADARLRQRFAKDRRERTLVITKFFEDLIAGHVLSGPRDAKTLDNLVKASWIVCDNWINYVWVDSTAAYPDCAMAGYEVVLDLFRPYLSPQSLSILHSSAEPVGGELGFG